MTIKKCRCGLYINRGLAVDAVVFRQRLVLLIKRRIDPDQGCWALPGGMVEWDETVAEAVRRELREETGLVATRWRQLPVFSSPRRFEQRVSVPFLIEATGQLKSGDDAAAVAWFPLDELPPLAFDHLEIIKAAKE